MNFYLDVFPADECPVISLDSTGYIHDVDLRALACEDDVESSCPFVGMMPEESNHEDGSPLDFGRTDLPNVGMSLVKRKRTRRRLKKHEVEARQRNAEARLRGHVR
jgi:hypothetical protein